jgi:hypothetical protein
MNRLASSAVLLAYLAGAIAASLQLPARHPSLDGLALRPAHRWARSAPSPATQTTQPATDTFELRFRGRPARSDLGGLSTRDDQFFVVFSEGAVRPSPGQTSVHIEVTPLDPAALGPGPEGLQAVGKVYRLQLSYAPSGRPIESFAAEVRAGFSYSLAASTALADLTVVHSRDGRIWTRLATDAPSAREATSQIPSPGYLLLATSPAAITGDTPGARLRLLALALVAGLALVAVLLVLRWRARPRGRHQGPPTAAGPGRPR